MNEKQNLYMDSYLKYLNKRKKHQTQTISNSNSTYSLSDRRDLLEQAGINPLDGSVNLEKFALLSSEMKIEILRILIDVYNLNQSEQVLKLIKLLKKDTEKQIINEVPENQKQTAKGAIYFSSTQTAEREIVDLKAKQYSNFMFERAKNTNFKATTKPVLSTAKLQHLSRAELVSMFTPKVFYSLSDIQRHTLCQAIVNDYLQSNGVEPCAVKTTKLPIGGTTICFGNYNPAKGVIELNSELFGSCDDFDNTQNQCFPYQLLSTLIHEAQHRVQFANLDKIATSEAANLMKESLLSPQFGKSFADYLAEPDELDARNASLKYFKDCVSQSLSVEESFALASFYNQAKIKEQNNKKSAVCDVLEKQNTELYDKSMFKLPSNVQSKMQAENYEMFEILLGKSKELSKKFGQF